MSHASVVVTQGFAPPPPGWWAGAYPQRQTSSVAKAKKLDFVLLFVIPPAAARPAPTLTIAF